jgi:Cation transport ATPase
MFIANLSVAEALDSLKTTEQGLTDVEAQRRLREFGYNRLEVVEQKSILLRFLGEFTHFFALILWIAAGQSTQRRDVNTGDRHSRRYSDQWDIFVLARVSRRACYFGINQIITPTSACAP